MMTARDILKLATERTDEALRGEFGKSAAFIRFISGHSRTIEGEISALTTSLNYNPFPLVAMFTEGLTESTDNGVLEFRVPKTAIIIRTKRNTTEEQKLNDSFTAVLHPIYEEFERQLRSLYFGYSLRVERTDLPCMTDTTGRTSLNQLCDAVLIRNLRFRHIVKSC